MPALLIRRLGLAAFAGAVGLADCFLYAAHLLRWAAAMRALAAALKRLRRLPFCAGAVVILVAARWPARIWCSSAIFPWIFCHSASYPTMAAFKVDSSSGMLRKLPRTFTKWFYMDNTTAEAPTKSVAQGFHRSRGIHSSVVTSKPAIRGHFKTGQRAAPRT